MFSYNVVKFLISVNIVLLYFFNAFASESNSFNKAFNEGLKKNLFSSIFPSLLIFVGALIAITLINRFFNRGKNNKSKKFYRKRL